MADSAPSVALLGRDDAVRAQLRKALAELGAVLVYEGEYRGIDPQLVLAHRPAVVLFNLDAAGEEALEGLDALIEGESLRVIFNEAETTAALSGWDLARWARHLAAKVLGHDRTIPPPPAGAAVLPEPGSELDESAQLVPGAPATPESLVVDFSMASLADEAQSLLDQVPTSDSLVGDAVVLMAVTEPVAADGLDLDLSDIESALSNADADAVEVAHRVAPEMIEVEDLPVEDVATGLPTLSLSEADEGVEVEDIVAIEETITDAIEDEDRFDIDSIEVALDRRIDEVTLESSEKIAGHEDDLVDLQAELASLVAGSLDEVTDNAALGVAAYDAEEDPVAAIGHLGGGFDAGDEAEESELDEAVAALAAQLDALESSAPVLSEEVRDPDFAFDLKIDADVVTADLSPNNVTASASTLSLADPGAIPAVAVPVGQGDTKSFNIDYLSLEDLPDPGLLVIPTKAKVEDSPYLARPGIDMTLVPREDMGEIKPETPLPSSHDAVKADIGEAVADAEVAEEEEDPLAAFSLEPIAKSENTTKVVRISRVIVLGASIGGPDALRTFLAGLPQEFPALFILAQHLESGFFDRLAQQLQKISKLPVRVAGPYVKATMSEVLVVPSGNRVIVGRDGEVSLEPYATPTHYQPCIDDVLRDVADRFGAKATAIIFSGMAGDAVEGAVYLTAKGGEVWAQDPASCVVSSMVDGALARGVVEFVGSPRELAEQCVARFGKE